MLLFSAFSQVKNIPFDPDEFPGLGWVIGIVTIVIFLYFGFRFVEVLYVKYYRRPLFVHGYLRLEQMPAHTQHYLHTTIAFYRQLNNRHQKYFRHRILIFLRETTIIGREGLHIDQEKSIAIAALAVQMTFGMRSYILPYLKTIIVYPSSFYSVLNKEEHTGEFNPRLKTMVLSWEHFCKGNRVQDGVNLGIHELTHVIHFNAIKSNDVSSEIFYDTFLELEQYLGSVQVRKQLVSAQLLRAYAYTDKFEFIAVLVEVFMESPDTLKQPFPKIYRLVRQMLNYRY